MLPPGSWLIGAMGISRDLDRACGGSVIQSSEWVVLWISTLLQVLAVQRAELANAIPLRVDPSSFRSSWARILPLIRAGEPVIGLDRSRNPSEDLSWVAMGFDTTARVYREEQWFENYIPEPLRVKAGAVHTMMRSVVTLDSLQNESYQTILEMFTAFLDRIMHGTMLHGPLLGFAYMRRHAFYEYAAETAHPYTLPCYKPGQRPGVLPSMMC